MQAAKAIRVSAGFTLVEMLIVVTIIGILAVLAVGSFGGMTRTVKLDLATDNIVSLIKQQQGNVTGGRSETLDGESRLFCHGIRFVAGGGESDSGQMEQIALLKVPYVRLGTSRADFCDLQIQNVKQYATAASFDSSSDIAIASIKSGNDEMKSINILFKPPLAKIVVSDERGELSGNSAITLEIKGLNSDEVQYLDFYPATGVTKKYKK